ncbi:DUF4833 domain-containing protein [Sphingobacteriaceae bacterium]|nr:DUF4833 domain-containing protein [Sphingobacteriaceae bacterium]
MRRVLIVLMFFLTSIFSRAQKITPFYGPFPEPAPTKNMLFYLQRTVDRNTVIYEVNLEPDGELNAKNPIKTYWIDFDNEAKRSSLTFLQSKFAYGIESELIDEPNKIYAISLVSNKKIKFYLKRDIKTKQYHVHANIKGKSVILSRIFVNIIGGTYMQPTVSYVELAGHEPQSEKIITEKIIVK